MTKHQIRWWGQQGFLGGRVTQAKAEEGMWVNYTEATYMYYTRVHSLTYIFYLFLLSSHYF